MGALLFAGLAFSPRRLAARAHTARLRARVEAAFGSPRQPASSPARPSQCPRATGPPGRRPHRVTDFARAADLSPCATDLEIRCAAARLRRVGFRAGRRQSSNRPRICSIPRRAHLYAPRPTRDRSLGFLAKPGLSIHGSLTAKRGGAGLVGQRLGAAAAPHRPRLRTASRVDERYSARAMVKTLTAAAPASSSASAASPAVAPVVSTSSTRRTRCPAHLFGTPTNAPATFRVRASRSRPTCGAVCRRRRTARGSSLRAAALARGRARSKA